jgi:hypothetical protein
MATTSFDLSRLLNTVVCEAEDNAKMMARSIIEREFDQHAQDQRDTESLIEHVVARISAQAAKSASLINVTGGSHTGVLHAAAEAQGWGNVASSIRWEVRDIIDEVKRANDDD